MDSQLLTAVLVIGAVVTAIAVVTVRSRGFRKPQMRPQQWARVHGWTYRKLDPSLLDRFSRPPFRRGYARQATDVLAGAWNGDPAISFQYEYSTWGRTQQTNPARHVLALTLPAPLPWLQLEPDGVGDLIELSAPGQKVELESATFNERWDVQGPDGSSPHDFLHPRMMARLLQPDAAGLAITVDGAQLVAIRIGYQQLDRIEPTLALLSDLIALVPRFVWQDAGHRPQS